MKRILLIIIVLFSTSCRLTQHYTKYIDKNQYGRLHLKNMKFEKSFTKEMMNKIEADAIYVNYYENNSINLIGYSYLRFFKFGQFATFHSKTENANINDIQKASVVGYYNIKNGILLLELPNTSFSKAGKRSIRKFVIAGDTLKLKEKIKSNETETIFTKVKIKEIAPVLPDW
ncbi:hypothetical protein CLU81_3701 [Flavobacterium sp. 9]|uniref:hypothetical protein n=1 Tax=Flavobacterium sp. 9 TaxID=2035198 RepID=UPI000C491282|nr:hypothetical protein [Flavobacterium sp. 9]PIF33126.1 hypothetical protein CLU81_3701 [Flavobacterium sp. 9]